MSRNLPAWCSDSTPVMWSSTTTTSSTWPTHCGAKMPIVAEPQPTRMRRSSTPSTIGAPVGADDDASRRLRSASSTGSLVAERHHHLAGDAPFLLRAAGEVVHAAERQELRAVLDRADVADRLAVMAHRRLLGAEVAVGVDLHLEAAVAEDAFGDDGDEVDAFVLRGDDEGRRLVVGIGRARADAGDEHRRVGAPWSATSAPSQPPSCAACQATRSTPGRATRCSVSSRVSTPSTLP